MNPRATAILWFLTLVTIMVAVFAPAFWYVPLIVAGAYLIYALS